MSAATRRRRFESSTRSRRTSSARATGTRARRFCARPPKPPLGRPRQRTSRGAEAEVSAPLIFQENKMALKDFADTLPEYAKDLRLNLGSLLSDQMLGDQRKYGLLLACAHGT